MSEAEQETQIPEPEPVTEPEPDENEQGEDAPAEDAPPEPEPEPEAEPQGDEERTEAFRKIDGSFKTYSRNVEKQLSEEITDWLYCPLCASGAVPGYVNRHDMGRVPEEVQANVKTFFGLARETDYQSAPGITTCTDCGGLGKVSTGSRVAEHATITCPTCKGYGYTPPPGVHTGNGHATGSQAQQVTEALAELDTPDRDNWGEPRILPDGTLNDNFGKMPQFKTVHPVYGVTANLSPEELISG